MEPAAAHRGSGCVFLFPDRAHPQITAVIEWAVAACISSSLLWPLGMMAATSVLMAFGLWCFVAGWWKWQPADKSSAVMNVTFAVYAVGSAALSLLHGDSMAKFEGYPVFLGACLLGIGLRVAQPRPFVIGASFSLGAFLAAVASVAQVLAAPEMHRARFFLVGTTFGTMGALYAIICVSMFLWPGVARATGQRAVFIAGAVCGVIIALLSGSKGSWLMLALVMPLALAVIGDRPTWKKRMLLLTVLAVLAGAVAFVPNSPVIPRIEEALREGDRCRAAYWQESLALFREAPWIGVGRRKLEQRVDAAALKVRNNIPFPEGPPTDAHNEYLDALASRGLAGLVLVLAAIAVPLTIFARLRPSARAPAAAGLLFAIAFAVSGLTDVLFAINIKRTTYLLFVLFCILEATPTEQKTGHP